MLLWLFLAAQLWVKKTYRYLNVLSQVARTNASPVHLFLLPAGQLHGDAHLFIEAARHTKVFRQARVAGWVVGERRGRGGLQRGHGRRLVGVGHVFSISAGQRERQGLLDRPEDRKMKKSCQVLLNNRKSIIRIASLQIFIKGWMKFCSQERIEEEKTNHRTLITHS